VPWHLDPPYEDPDAVAHDLPDFDVDICLDAFDAERGGLWVLPGAHLYCPPANAIQPGADLFADPRARPLAMQPGDVLLHALTMPHASLPNLGNAVRRIIYLHYMAEPTFLRSRRRWGPGAGGFGVEVLHACLGMMEAREALGLAPCDAGGVMLTPDGLSLPEVWTPPFHWRALREARLANGPGGAE
jgi:hypothetical protein